MGAKRPPNRTETTPSGIVIDFWDDVGVDGAPQQRRYALNGERSVSVTTVTGIYDKPAFLYVAERINAEGTIALAGDGCPIANLDAPELVGLLRENGLDYASVWADAAARGDVAHEHLLELIRDGKVAKLEAFDPAHRPWVSAGMRWVVDHRPEVIDAETMVASLKHGFAGRYDLHARLPDGRTGRVDFKTVTEWKYRDGRLLPPYDEHLSQVEGYEIAAPESGYDPSDFRAVVRLGPDGRYDYTESWLGPEHFLGDLAAYRNRQAKAAAGSAARKARAEQAVAA